MERGEDVAGRGEEGEERGEEGGEGMEAGNSGEGTVERGGDVCGQERKIQRELRDTSHFAIENCLQNARYQRASQVK